MTPLAVSFNHSSLLVWLLVVPVVAGLYWLAQRRKRRYPVRFTALSTLAAVVPATPAWRRHVPAALFVLALTALAISLAKPQRTIAIPIERASVVLVTDVSRSMQATDVQPDRLSAARGAAKTFLDRVPKSLRVGLVAFSDTAETLQSPSNDRDAVRASLDGLSPVAGTATGAGLNTALDALRVGRGAKRPPSAIILLSDGSATDGDAAYEAARAARRQKIPIYTVALGTPDGQVTLPDGRTINVPPDTEALKRIAELSGGAAYSASDSKQLDDVYKRLGSQIGTRKGKREITTAFAGGALILLLMSVAGSLRWRGRIP
jgi:Ca-activated chloride channel family protein